MSKNSVALRKEQPLIDHTMVNQFMAHAGEGMETVNASDVLIPRLTILQGLSPQLKKTAAEYIAGAEQGDIADVALSRIYKEGILFLPVLYRKEWLEWTPRESGGGLVQIHSDPAILQSCTQNEKRQSVLPNKNIISETAQFFGFNLTGNMDRVFIPMASTQLKKAKKIITFATEEKLLDGNNVKFTPPLYYRAYKLGTTTEKNNKGEWFGWTVERGPALPELTQETYGFDWKVLFDQAKSFRDSLVQGRARADVSHYEPAQDEEVM